MGFTPPGLRRLAFEDPTYAEWEVDSRKPDVRTWMRVSTLTDKTEGGLSINNPDHADQVDELVAIIGSHLAGWNLEDEAGRPVPLSVEAVAGLDKDTTQALVEAWIGSMVLVSAPLQQPSVGGSPVDGMPMTPNVQAS